MPKTFVVQKAKGAVDPSTATRWFKKLHLGCKKLNDKARLDRFNTMKGTDTSLSHCKELRSNTDTTLILDRDTTLILDREARSDTLILGRMHKHCTVPEQSIQILWF